MDEMWLFKSAGGGLPPLQINIESRFESGGQKNSFANSAQMNCSIAAHLPNVAQIYDTIL
jgi:hypothetical protein